MKNVPLPVNGYFQQCCAVFFNISTLQCDSSPQYKDSNNTNWLLVCSGHLDQTSG